VVVASYAMSSTNAAKDHESTSTPTDATVDEADFVRFMMDVGVLRFGSFVTKSGRETPYFINTGLYRTGSQIRDLGRFYAQAIVAHLGTEFDVLFGPAYKGIPLAVATASALAEQGVDVAYCFNRKEAKDHGEGGILVGHELADGDRVVIVEDITTAGTAVRDVIPQLRAAADVTLAGLVVSVDRRERGPADGPSDGRSALQSLAEEFAMPAFALVDVHDIIRHGGLDESMIAAVNDYLDRYGVDSLT